jgi:hypothetical protein
MNKSNIKHPTSNIQLSISCCLGLLLFGFGCTTTPSGSKIPDPALLQLTAQEASAVGTILWLKDHPNDRAKFELARTSLKGLVAAGSGSPADLQAALQSLPISELNGTQGAVIISSAVVLMDRAGQQLVGLDKSQIWSRYVAPIAMGLAAGLDQGLIPAPN